MLSLAAALLSAAATTAPRPNVVFVMADDHAAHAISAYGSRVNETPNIDRLAREGMLFGNVFDHWEILPGQGVYNDAVLYTATGEKTYTGRYATDVITDLGIEFIRNRPKDRPFFLMLHHKAPHREWTPDEKHRRLFENRVIPEAPTLWDDYSTRTDAIHENQQRVADDMTNRDLKREPPAGLEGAAREAWLGRKPTEVTITVATGGRRCTTGITTTPATTTRAPTTASARRPTS
jgi:arylsulfatase A-like enzyme